MVICQSYIKLPEENTRKQNCQKWKTKQTSQQKTKKVQKHPCSCCEQFPKVGRNSDHLANACPESLFFNHVPIPNQNTKWTNRPIMIFSLSSYFPYIWLCIGVPKLLGPFEASFTGCCRWYLLHTCQIKHTILLTKWAAKNTTYPYYNAFGVVNMTNQQLCV